MQSVYIKKPHHKQETDVSCLPACARMLLEFHGIAVSERTLCKQLSTKSFGTYPLDVLTLNKTPPGIQARIDFWSLNELLAYIAKNKVPCIVPLWTGPLDYWDGNYPHAVLVTGFDDDRITLNDPFFDENEFNVSIDSFVEAWYLYDGLVITITKK
jgi:ABC-type bacteriocin/lantibiotic exporter with double-glycine peptidase domain